MDPLLFLTYINDLSNKLKYNVKLFVDDTSLFTVVNDKIDSANILDNDLQSISTWAYDWKTLFKLDSSNPAQEVLFSRKEKVSTMFRLKDCLFKNIYVSYLMKNLILSNILI